jgi:hypothetical protein
VCAAWYRQRSASSIVREAFDLRDVRGISLDVVEDEALAQGQVAQHELLRTECPEDRVEENRARDGQIGPARVQSGHRQPLLQIHVRERLAELVERPRPDAETAEIPDFLARVLCRRQRAEAENGAGGSHDALKPPPAKLREKCPCLFLDVPHQPAFVPRADGIALHEAFRHPDDAQLEAARQSSLRRPAPRDLDTAAPDVHHHGLAALEVGAVGGRQMDEPCLLGAGDDLRVDAGLLRDGIEEIAAVLGLPCSARGAGDDLVDAVRIGEPLELRQGLQARRHGLRGQSAAVQATRPQTDHVLLTVDDLEGQVGPHADDDHVDGVRADVDGCEAHDRISGETVRGGVILP